MDWYYRKSAWAATDTDWIFLGLSHPIDLVRWYLGRIREVHAFATRSAMGAAHDLGGNDIYVVNLVSEDGRLGRAMGHYGCHELPTARNCIELMLYASGGTSLAQYHDMRYIHTAFRADTLARGFDAGELEEVTEDCLYAGRHYYFNSEVHGMHYGEFANYADHFARAIIEGHDASPGLEEGVETVCVMEAARRADIVLEEGVDVLDAGVEIISNPPGKPSFSNSLLSGGEKALTALALLLAIFQHQPSPFCVLDEVDAPWDESNIGRFIDVLKEFLSWTRFVIVTHSKKTMTAATTLYGVTMQESGVSKRVSVRFEDVSDDGHIADEALSRDDSARDDQEDAA
jgi:hypothetical protein